ncbi:hypothetical protein GGTG_08767 [Gaeumannomyces tritici R3-111a-1]|uniref:Uncharacterized protein n=1 Tax=Gaeumannomyces tritici (strain R3-111a-1) TaxID=644352 RepID=J3P5H8_GAET3|nr:hypothetical protein GGTG_08767 [Gaeumannomyces tritici R3-111a-1]EJT74929.1 hypothetical protein GGTG_08767 [Gaeumannomyces tritici R3-111a-1]
MGKGVDVKRFKNQEPLFLQTAALGKPVDAAGDEAMGGVCGRGAGWREPANGSAETRNGPREKDGCDEGGDDRGGGVKAGLARAGLSLGLVRWYGCQSGRRTVLLGGLCRGQSLDLDTAKEKSGLALPSWGRSEQALGRRQQHHPGMRHPTNSPPRKVPRRPSWVLGRVDERGRSVTPPAPDDPTVRWYGCQSGRRTVLLGGLCRGQSLDLDTAKEKSGLALPSWGRSEQALGRRQQHHPGMRHPTNSPPRKVPRRPSWVLGRVDERGRSVTPPAPDDPTVRPRQADNVAALCQCSPCLLLRLTLQGRTDPRRASAWGRAGLGQSEQVQM